MRIKLTGAAGELGREVLRDLLSHDHEVLAVDRVPMPPGCGCGSTVVDLTDLGQTLDTVLGNDDRLGGFDAIVHLAAVPAGGIVPDGEVFSNNTVSTYNVFSATRRAGIRTVVWASSETVLGLPFSELPEELPVDESVVRPNSSYSLSKACGEEMARQFCRWAPEMTIVGLRFSNVMVEADYAMFETWQDAPESRAWNLWGYIDARDAAQAIRRAMALGRPGAHVYTIANGDTVMRRPNSELLVGRYAEVPVTGDVSGRRTLLSIERTRRELGYEPEHDWGSRR